MKFMDKVRDVLYDSVDYIFMIVIVLVVIGVIGWRLDVLFAKDALVSNTPGQVIVDNSGRIEEDPVEPSDQPELTDEDQEDQDDEEPAQEPQDEPEQPAQPSITVVQVEIPVGSMPGKIGLILEEKGVVTSSREFIAKAVELGLDTKLKSGTYKIQLGLPTEDIVRLLTN